MQQPATPSWRQTSPPTPNGRQYDPYAHAELLGIQVLFRPLRTANEMWLPEHSTIVVQESLRSVHRRSALTHGVAHAVLGHEDDRPRFEVAADRLAGEYLIDGEEIRDLIRYLPDSARLANELGVTTRVLRVYLNVHRLAG